MKRRTSELLIAMSIEALLLQTLVLGGCAGREDTVFDIENGKIVPSTNSSYVQRNNFLRRDQNLYEVDALSDSWIRFLVSRGGSYHPGGTKLDVLYFRCPGNQSVSITRYKPNLLGFPTFEERVAQFTKYMESMVSLNEVQKNRLEIGGQRALSIEYEIDGATFPGLRGESFCSTAKRTTERVRIKDVVVELGSHQLVVMSIASSPETFGKVVGEFDQMTQTLRIRQ